MPGLLTKLSPAETLTILERGRPRIQLLLRYTAGDLLLRNVLRIEKGEARVESGERIYASYVKTGARFDQYNGRRHEMVFLSPFHRDRSLRMLLMHWVAMAFETVGIGRSYRKFILGSVALGDYFNSGLFGRKRMTHEGESAREAILKEIVELQRDLAEMFDTQPEQARQLVMTIGGNIFFLKGADISVLSEIDVTLVDQYINRPDDYERVPTR